jgi:hypothetical protein
MLTKFAILHPRIVICKISEIIEHCLVYTAKLHQILEEV